MALPERQQCSGEREWQREHRMLELDHFERQPQPFPKRHPSYPLYSLSSSYSVVCLPNSEFCLLNSSPCVFVTILIHASPSTRRAVVFGMLRAQSHRSRRLSHAAGDASRRPGDSGRDHDRQHRPDARPDVPNVARARPRDAVRLSQTRTIIRFSCIKHLFRWMSSGWIRIATSSTSRKTCSHAKPKPASALDMAAKRFRPSRSRSEPAWPANTAYTGTKDPMVKPYAGL